MRSMNNVLCYVETCVSAQPSKIAVIDEVSQTSYIELYEASKRVGTALSRCGVARQGVVVLMEKSAHTLGVMLGIVQAGAFYVPVDPSVPLARLQKIVTQLGNPCIVVDSQEAAPAGVDEMGHVVEAQELLGSDIDETLLAATRAQSLETDPVYTLFTSGSTGDPKGVAISHRAIISFIDSFVSTFDFNENDRFANQAPFDFDVSTKDIYTTFATGATLVIVPRAYFMQPVKLVEYLHQHKATVLVWAVAALCIASAYHALDSDLLASVRKVLFSGEVMPRKHLDEWRAHLPQAQFVNLYGPTEITCNCLYHVLDSARMYAEGIPLGTAFSHCRVFLVDSAGAQVTEPNSEGELVVAGPSLALGYVGMPEQTARAFPTNALNAAYPERVYRTGDVAAFSEEGELFFRGRVDNQIKFQGHRIELEEIDVAIERHPQVMRCRCAFDTEKSRLRAFYEGAVDKRELASYARRELPVHMIPSSFEQVEEMPLNKNGKVDRKRLLELHAKARKAKRGTAGASASADAKPTAAGASAASAPTATAAVAGVAASADAKLTACRKTDEGVL